MLAYVGEIRSFSRFEEFMGFLWYSIRSKRRCP
jgi:hypothetical protein